MVDTSKRIQQYIDLAKQLGQKLRLNLEIDVGLHRGGFANLESLKNALNIIYRKINTILFLILMLSFKVAGFAFYRMPKYVLGLKNEIKTRHYLFTHITFRF